MGRERGTPSPNEWIRARAVEGSGDGTRTLFLGATFDSTAERSARFACAGCSRARARFKASVGGSLVIHFVSPDGETRYGAGSVTAVTVTADTETLISTDAIYGEAWLDVAFTPSSGSGAVTLFDFMAL